jgi:hypothetical protein
VARRLGLLCRPGLTHPDASRPSDVHVHLRFVRGSPATVMRVDAVTGWIEVRGEPFQSTANTRWIALRHLANQPGAGESTTDALAWCPPKGLPAPHTSGRLRLATGNLENLHVQDGQSTYLEPAPSRRKVAQRDSGAAERSQRCCDRRVGRACMCDIVVLWRSPGSSGRR